MTQFCQRLRELKKQHRVVGMRKARAKLDHQVELEAQPEEGDDAAIAEVGQRSQPVESNGVDAPEAAPMPSLARLTPLSLPEPEAVSSSAGGSRVPNQHLIRDSWFDKAGTPLYGGSSSSASGHRGPEPEALHFAEAHLRSFADFMRQGLRSKVRQVQNLARLSPDSVVVITSEEVKAREPNVEVAMWRGGVAPPGVKAVRLGSLFDYKDIDRSRFSIELLPDLLYFVPPSMTEDQARREGKDSVVCAMVPARVSDAAADFAFEVHVELGSFPLLSEHGLFVISGNPYVLVHRLVKANAVYYSQATSIVPNRPKTHKLELVTLVYARLKVCSEGGEVFFLMPGNKAKIPAMHFLVALGLTKAELQLARNYKLLVPEDLPTRAEACETVCELTGIRTSFFEGDAVKTFLWRAQIFMNGPLGVSGRARYNERLGLTLEEETLTNMDILAAADLILDVDLGVRALQVDDVDAMNNKRLRCIGEVFQEWTQDWLAAVLEKAGSLPILVDATQHSGKLEPSTPAMMDSFVKRLWTENNWQLSDDTNALVEIMQARRVSQVGDQGLDKIKRIKGLRLIHPTQYGRICPIETGEGMTAGISMTLATYARVTPEGMIVVPHQRVIGSRRMLDEPWEYLEAVEQNKYRVAQFDNAHLPDGTIVGPLRLADESEEDAGGDQESRVLNAVHLGMFKTNPLSRVDYIQCSPPISPAVATIPFLEHDDANRILMGAKMQQQAVPCLYPERPIVGSGIEAHIASCSSWSVFSSFAGQVLYADSTVVSTVSSSIVEAGDTKEEEEAQVVLAWDDEEDPDELPEGWVEKKMQVRTEMNNSRLIDVADSKKHTFRHHSCAVTPGASVSVGEAVAEGSCISGGELAIGKNVVVAYLPYLGYNYEDAIVLSKRCVRDDIFTSVHVVEVEREMEDDEELVPFLDEEAEPSSVYLDERGIVREGAWVETGDILFSYRRLEMPPEEGSETSFLEMPEAPKLRHKRVPDDTRGRVVDRIVETREILKRGGGSKRVKRQFVVIRMAMTCRVQIGDKLSGRHGNKGIVANIVDERDMPYLPDGTPVDICLNPLGVPSRMNVGQIFECLLGTAGRWTGQDYRVGQFDEMYAEEASRGLVFEALRRARDRTGYKWILDPDSPGKTRLYDGRTGRPFDQTVTAGISYILKLYHMVRDKYVARGAGDKGYNMLTMQPQKGRRLHGGQRLGEMEVSALIGHGASSMLQEMVTVKSDDVEGRREVEFALTSGREVELPEGATSEGYLTFRHELQAAGLAITEGTSGRRRAAESR